MAAPSEIRVGAAFRPAGELVSEIRNEADDEIPRRNTHTAEHAETDRAL